MTFPFTYCLYLCLFDVVDVTEICVWVLGKIIYQQFWEVNLTAITFPSTYCLYPMHVWCCGCPPLYSQWEHCQWCPAVGRKDGSLFCCRRASAGKIVVDIWPCRWKLDVERPYWEDDASVKGNILYENPVDDVLKERRKHGSIVGGRRASTGKIVVDIWLGCCWSM